MKKLVSFAVIAIVAISSFSFNASAKNSSAEAVSSSASSSAYGYLLGDEGKALIMGVERSLQDSGYQILSMEKNEIYAVKVKPSRKDRFTNASPKITTKKNEKYIEIPTVTVTFSQTENGIQANMENGVTKEKLSTWVEKNQSNMRPERRHFGRRS